MQINNGIPWLLWYITLNNLHYVFRHHYKWQTLKIVHNILNSMLQEQTYANTASLKESAILKPCHPSAKQKLCSWEVTRSWYTYSLASPLVTVHSAFTTEPLGEVNEPLSPSVRMSYRWLCLSPSDGIQTLSLQDGVESLCPWFTSHYHKCFSALDHKDNLFN